MDKLLIASTYLPPIAGGAEQVAWEVAKRLTNKFEVHILTSGSSSTNVKEDIIIHYIPPLPLMTIFYSSIRSHVIDKVLSEARPDIVHSHLALPWGYVFRKMDLKRVITCHGSDVFPKKGIPVKLFLMSALKSSNAITAPSKWFAKYVERNYGVACVTIPNGVDTNIFRPLENIERQDNVILFVGRFIKRKGILDLVEAARALPEYEFWLVGNPKQKDAVEIPRLLNIKITGFVEDIVPCYNRATICVFPSHWENFSMVGLEAMACGKGIIATELGFSEYIENGREGILVEPGDVKGLVDSIKYLMENEDVRRRLEKNARKKAVQYDWSVIAEQYHIFYERL